MTLLSLIAAGAVTSCVCELFVRTPGTAVRSRISPIGDRSAVCFLLTPILGAVAGLTTAMIVPWPVLACLITLVGHGVLLIVSNTKLKVLRQVYAAQDVDNIRHLFLYPAFYLVHLGWTKTITGFCVIGCIIFGLVWMDEPQFLVTGLGHPLLSWLAQCLIWWSGYRLFMTLLGRVVTEGRAKALGLSGDPNVDTARHGLYATVFFHSLLVKDQTHLKPLSARYAKTLRAPTIRPHIIALQGESYLDLARIDRLVGAKGPWSALQALRDKGAVTGRLSVPSWGAYTMQTEMGFLSTIPHGDYKTAGLNPYLAVASKRPVWSIAKGLTDCGYTSVCLHPAKRGFFRRHAVMPNLGMDTFVTMSAFEGAERFGPYVSDKALGNKIEDLITQADTPLFLHGITIESHGPWTAGRLAPFGVNEAEALAAEPTADQEFSLYRRHMENLLTLVDRLLKLGTPERPIVLALYGDHQPAMGDLFDRLGFEDPTVDYLLASSGDVTSATEIQDGPRTITELGPDLLRLAGFKVTGREKDSEA